MDLGIAGRRAAVAAGSAGLGFGAAASLAAEGALVAICGRDRGRLDDAVGRLGKGAVGIEADVSDPDAAGGFVAAAADALGGPIEILVANAGGPPPGSASQTSLDDYQRALDLNFLSTVAMCNAAVGPMRAQGWGRIVAITSIGARQPIGSLAASSAARAAVTSYVKNLSREVAPDGITANTVQPGSHDTERIRALHGDSAAASAQIPVGHLGDPADFGAVVAFLCSRQARFVTGAALIVDGGASLALQ
jgi:3-oxoacyl-[acyl-carrier protein] reductase